MTVPHRRGSWMMVGADASPLLFPPAFMKIGTVNSRRFRKGTTVCEAAHIPRTPGCFFRGTKHTTGSIVAEAHADDWGALFFQQKARAGGGGAGYPSVQVDLGSKRSTTGGSGGLQRRVCREQGGNSIQRMVAHGLRLMSPEGREMSTWACGLRKRAWRKRT